MNSDSSNNKDQISAALLQRSDELNDIPNLTPDDIGMIHSKVLVLKDFIIFPRMISPIFISDPEDLRVIGEVLEKNTTLIGMIKN